MAFPVALTTASRVKVWARRDGVELVAAMAVPAAWLALVTHEVTPHVHGLTSGSTSPAAVTATGVIAHLGGWMVMVVAMMGPVVLPAIRHVARSSLRWRRTRAVLEFTAVYVGLWLGFGVLALVAVSAVTPSGWLVAVILAVAAVWQLTPLKRRFLRNCNRAVPLPPTGRPATVGCSRFGWVHGLACIGSCWCVMAVMAAAPSGHLLWSAALTPVVIHERFARKPRRAARQAAVGLAVAALVVGVLTATT